MFGGYRTGARSLPISRPRSWQRYGRVDDVMEYLASGMSADEVVDHFPELTVDHVRLALESQHEESAALGEGDVVDLVPIWQEVAGRMEAHLAAGRWHLLTEDVLRWATIDDAAPRTSPSSTTAIAPQGHVGSRPRSRALNDEGPSRRKRRLTRTF